MTDRDSIRYASLAMPAAVAILTIGMLLLFTGAATWFYADVALGSTSLALLSAIGLGGLTLGWLWLRKITGGNACTTWGSVKGRQHEATVISIPMAATSLIWIAIAFLPELTSGGVPHLGRLQWTMLITGLIGLALAGTTLVYMRWYAPTWLPMVAPGSAVEPFGGPVTYGTQEDIDMLRVDTMEVEVSPSNAEQVRWSVSTDTVVIVANEPIFVVIAEPGDEPTSSPAVNIYHVSTACSIGCPAALEIPAGFVFTTLSTSERRGASFIRGSIAPLQDATAPVGGTVELSALERNRSTGEPFEYNHCDRVIGRGRYHRQLT